jgi:hypothetical protein
MALTPPALLDRRWTRAALGRWSAASPRRPGFMRPLPLAGAAAGLPAAVDRCAGSLSLSARSATFLSWGAPTLESLPSRFGLSRYPDQLAIVTAALMGVLLAEVIFGLAVISCYFAPMPGLLLCIPTLKVQLSHDAAILLSS